VHQKISYAGHEIVCSTRRMQLKARQCHAGWRWAPMRVTGSLRRKRKRSPRRWIRRRRSRRSGRGGGGREPRRDPEGGNEGGRRGRGGSSRRPRPVRLQYLSTSCHDQSLLHQGPSAPRRPCANDCLQPTLAFGAA
jgi:hypothetical protein